MPCLTPDQRRQIVTLRRQGVGLDDIAGRVGTTRSTVYYHCRQEGLTGQGIHARGYRAKLRVLTEAQRDELLRLRAEGRPLAELAARYGVSEAAAGRHCRQAGLAHHWSGPPDSMDPATVRQLRRDVLEEGEPILAAARRYGVGRATVQRAVLGLTYPYAGGPTRQPIPWSDRHCTRCSLLLPEYHRGPLCQLCARGE